MKMAYTRHPAYADLDRELDRSMRAHSRREMATHAAFVTGMFFISSIWLCGAVLVCFATWDFVTR
jgi:hypothetical protein